MTRQLLFSGFAAIAAMVIGGCGPGSRASCSDDLLTDPNNCGTCDVVCGGVGECIAGECSTAECHSGDTQECYSGAIGTAGIGECRSGTRTCSTAGMWGVCADEVVPRAEICGNNIDENCSGAADEDVDLDGDGFTTCQGDCCDSFECTAPGLVNPNAFEDPDNGFDDNCDGVLDEAIEFCDVGIASNTTLADDYARAIDICQLAPAVGGWGLVSATLSLPDGTGVPNPDSHSVRQAFGANLVPLGGSRLAEISSGVAADSDDTNPSPQSFQGASMGTQSEAPADFLAANGGALPNLAGCDAPFDTTANDAVMLTLEVRVPSNAHSFSLSSNFFSAEYPEWVCSEYNDFFVVLLDSTYTGDPANPADKNLAIYTDPDDVAYPVGVNLAYGDSGLFTQCRNGTTGCSGGVSGTQTSCDSIDDLIGTGLDLAQSGSCDSDSLLGGGTGWLTTSGNVVPGETIRLRIAIWDTSDSVLDSIAIVDNFRWSVESTDPGTVID